MGCLIAAAAIWFLGFGLWQHDWRIIVASAVLAVTWPLIADEVTFGEERRRRELLDQLWDDDDDLSESA